MYCSIFAKTHLSHPILHSLFNTDSITSNQLGGRLPSEITKLSSLRFIILENCCSASIPIYNAAGYKGISGSLPDDIGSLQGLLILKISYNYIGGTVCILLFASYRCTCLGYAHTLFARWLIHSATEITI